MNMFLTAWLLLAFVDTECYLQPQQAPDYRLYKSEPELTTVKEEVDEANGEDKTETSTEGKESAVLKGTP